MILINVCRTQYSYSTEDYSLNEHEVCHIVRYNIKGVGVALYVNQRFTYTLRAVKSKVTEHIFECVTVELDMRKTQIFECVTVELDTKNHINIIVSLFTENQGQT